MPFDTFLGRLKVKATLEGHITPTFILGFQNNFAQVFSLRRSSFI